MEPVIEVDKLARSETPKADLRKNASDFQLAYFALLAMIQPKVDDSTNVTALSTVALNNAPTHFDPSISPSKCPSETTVDPGSSKRSKPSSNQMSPSNPRTPDQPTVLPNSNYSGDSVLNGASNESADEELSKSFLKAFVDSTFACLDDDFAQLTWPKSGKM
jgi:hypothetical protein